MKPDLITANGLVLLFLSACAHQPLTPSLPETAFTTIAKDATGQLASLYPPAQTHFVLELDEGNVFDKRFKSQLRISGYALYETQDDAAALKPGGKKLSYLLDALTDVSQYGYYRLTLTIGEAQLSRLYDANDLGKPNYWSYRK